MYKTILPLIIACTVLQLTSCKKQCVKGSRVFQAFGTIFPNRNIFKVGDTIKIRVEVDKCGLELGSGIQMCMDDTQELELLLGLTRVSTDNRLTDSMVANGVGAYSNFKITPVKGRFFGAVANPAKRERLAFFRTAATPTKFQLWMDIVCLSPGIYRVTIGDLYRRWENHHCQTLGTITSLQYPNWQLDSITPRPWTQRVQTFVEAGYCIRVI